MGLTFRLGGKVALVTGASSGLGEAIARAFAEAGARVAVHGRDPERTRQVAAAVEGTPVIGALDSVAACRRVVDAAAGLWGGLDILVNNAGFNQPQPALEVTEAVWDSVMDLNLKYVFFCSQAAARHMLPRGWGRIINIGSQMGHVGLAGRAAYCASKGGVAQLTKVLALEWATQGVTVNAVSPTFVSTRLTERMLANPDFRQEVLRRIPLGRLGTPDEVAAACLYLASDHAALVTGHSLLTDGGWTAW